MAQQRGGSGKVTTYEWLGLITVLITGFWKLCGKLSKIEIALSGKVGFADCSRRQQECLCRNQVEKLQLKMDELHPHQK